MTNPISTGQQADETTLGHFTYTILRYVHDIGTAEFVNVGVVVASTHAPQVAAKFRTDIARVKAMFPSLDGEVFLARMKRLQACFDAIDETRCATLRACEGPSLMALIRRVLPLEDGALPWSPIGSGAGGPLIAALQAIYERSVLSNELRQGH
ncbi:DUF3037 domain-containing protein [Variovorax sp. KK3]|uniref:DUF3037 domain-containing protein n=1 Tax=Variovorax sp. KK3 TaxID=1855728 RepID=UPI00097BFF6E|nr:DUF3037 domain-containing protein [Variovorax sp. KK3]